MKKIFDKKQKFIILLITIFSLLTLSLITSFGFYKKVEKHDVIKSQIGGFNVPIFVSAKVFQTEISLEYKYEKENDLPVKYYYGTSEENLTNETTSNVLKKLKSNTNYYIKKCFVNDNKYETCSDIKKIKTAGEKINFDFTGNFQTFNASESGVYQIEAWGAQGGSSDFDSDYNAGGLGGYTSGDIKLNKNELLYIYVGGMPLSTKEAGYNGGGMSNSDGRYASGGGASDIRLVPGKWNDFNSLLNRIMVAAGGGGGYSYSGVEQSGGSGGGLIGGSGSVYMGATSEIRAPDGGTQISPGSIGSGQISSGQTGGFGYGALGGLYLTGGGSGYYGGASSAVNSDRHTTGSGGSSFISGHIGCNAISNTSTESNLIHTNQPNHYSGYVFTNTRMIDGNGNEWSNEKNSYIGQTQPDGTISLGHSGNGYVRIMLKSYIITESDKPVLFAASSTNDTIITQYSTSNNSILKFGINKDNLNMTTSKNVITNLTKDTEYYFQMCNTDMSESCSDISSLKTAGTVIDYNYTGNEQVYVTSAYDGKYKIETWGAQGGNITYNDITGTGGLGAYTSGIAKVKKNTNLYVYVGQNYNSYGTTNSYNGGGRGSYATSENDYNANGGGATDIRLINGNCEDSNSLKSRIMVAAGGGGSMYYYNGVANGGYAGGLIGGNGIGHAASTQTGPVAPGATQTSSSNISGTIAGKFGIGGSTTNGQLSMDYMYNSGGGGGYYGGSSGGATSGGFVSSAAGGSSFISGHNGCNSVNESLQHTNQSVHYSGIIFINTKMIDGAGYFWDNVRGNYVGQPQPNGTTAIGHSGNGYARITVLSYEI